MGSMSKIGLCYCPTPTKLTTSTPLSSKLKPSLCNYNNNTNNTNNNNNNNNTLSHIQTSGLIACLRAPSAELAIGAARAALNSGIQVLEVVMSTPDVFEVLHQLLKEYPTITLGVGTILKAEDAKEAIKVGAKFLMSPVMIQDILLNIKDDEVLYIPGVMTPTEILTAYNAGAIIVKLYPVSALGGVEYIAALKKPFGHIPMVASQGISIGQIREYIIRGASAVVLSDAIFEEESVKQGNFDCISQRARLAASVANEAVKHRRMVQGL
ncbi:uncharacterized protein LOC141598577 isoform X1 [Silene latifolia]|uniref:uncharacterized protein LOC141598577 isoform X1 n=1 Tax=Silene latifolia TaxID=37657 RepID=UPI003D7818D6